MNEQIKQLYANIGKIITASLSLDDILAGIMQEVRVFFQPQHWSLLRLDPSSKELFFVIVEGIDEEEVKKIRLKLGEGIAGKVAQTGESIFVSDAASDGRVSQRVDQATGFQTRSIIAVPMIFRNKVYGVIELINREPGGNFTEDEHLVMKTIADFSAIAFANAMMYEEMLQLSLTDTLTGLGNRARLDEFIQKQSKIKAAKRRADEGFNYTVFLIDLDNFKGINDELGHRTGDQVLKDVARTLKKTMRDEDHVFRIGGDEFLVLAKDQNPGHDQEISNRLSQALDKVFEPVKKKVGHCGYSLGIASATDQSKTILDLIHDADMSMYKTKEKHRARHEL